MLKLKSAAQTHIFRLANSATTMATLRDLVRNNFKKYPESFRFAFIDQEDDEIEVSTDEDLLNVFELAKLSQLGKVPDMIKLIVKQENPRQQPVEQQMIQPYQENSFEVLEQDNDSDYQQLASQCLSEAVEVIPSSEDLQLDKQVLSELIDHNLAKVQEQVISQVVEAEIISSEVEDYLTCLQTEVIAIQLAQKQPEPLLRFQQAPRRRNSALTPQEITAMVEKSLQKLLPGFIQTVSSKTISTVHQLLSERRIKQ